MAFQLPISIAHAVKAIQTQDYVLPAIQREFVWEEPQIVRLFDSVLRGYPIGSLLSWKIDPVTAAEFKFYGFIRDYHEKGGAQDGAQCFRGCAPPGESPTRGRRMRPDRIVVGDCDVMQRSETERRNESHTRGAPRKAAVTDPNYTC